MAIDLVEYLTNARNGSRLKRVSIKEMPPILPFQQLLCVVPPRSKRLLPSYLQNVYSDKQLAKYYPSKFEIDIESKTKEWEAIALLSFIKLSDIIVVYKNVKKKAKDKQLSTNYSRNVPGKSIEFWYSQKQYIYKSDYGTIERCRTWFTPLKTPI